MELHSEYFKEKYAEIYKIISEDSSGNVYNELHQTILENGGDHNLSKQVVLNILNIAAVDFFVTKFKVRKLEL